MKQSIILTLFIFLFQIGFSQSVESKRQMSLGIQTGYSISIPNTEAKFIEKVWKKFTKDFGKLTKNKKADEEFIEGATVKTISSNPMDIYTIIEENSITAFFDIKNGFINSTDYPKESKQAQEFITEFLYEVQREATKLELEKEQDALKKLNKNLDKLHKDLEDYKKDIEVAKDKIKKAELNIVQNGKDTEKTKSDIENQTKLVGEVTKKLESIGKKN
ncbi:MAG TPA: hypothetical protein PK006_00700 [Saprospiraceae bacterium]|nr:hypothetical protein [Saprospiraceae bacterium]